MKKFVFLGILLASSAMSFAQCDQDLILTSSKTEYLDSLGKMTRSQDEETTIKISKSQVIISPGNQDRQMIGTIKSTTCDWKVPFKEGKTVYKAVFDDQLGGELHATITTEGTTDKLTFLVEIVEIPERIRVNLTSFKAAPKK